MTTDGMVTDDTIVAISSAVGPAPRMLVRTSGGLSLEAASRLGAKPEAGPTLQTLHIEQMPVPAVVLAFPAGRSPTGQAVVEYHLPGNPLLCRLVVDALVRLGCRRAEAGEFTAR
ncbi:MAG: tRNA uridine-5-carboxymethylaminomethyl(34) synthesis GTPase MnmE, partial [Phycisphaerae bacterium]